MTAKLTVLFCVRNVLFRAMVFRNVPVIPPHRFNLRAFFQTARRMSASTEQIIKTYLDMPVEFWVKVLFATVVLVLLFVILKKLAHIGQIIGVVIVFVVLGIIVFKWVRHRGEPPVMTPVVDFLSSFFPQTAQSAQPAWQEAPLQFPQPVQAAPLTQPTPSTWPAQPPQSTQPPQPAQPTQPVRNPGADSLPPQAFPTITFPPPATKAPPTAKAPPAAKTPPATSKSAPAKSAPARPAPAKQPAK
jgi:hypothetical protein